MKIAYFVNHYPKVSHSFIRREILALERQGFAVQRIALRGWDDDLPDSEDRAEREKTRYVLQYGLTKLLLPTLQGFLRSPVRFFHAVRLAFQMAKDSDRPLPYHLIYLAEACCVLRWLRASTVELVHAHFGTNSTEIVMLSRTLGGPPYSFTVHGPDEFLRPMGLEKKIRMAASVVAISSFGRSQLFLRSKICDWPKIQVVRCGLERAFYEISPTPVPDTPRLVCVGRLCEAKGQMLLVQAAAKLVANGIDFHIVLAGDGPLRGALTELIQELRLEKHIRITGWLSSDDVRREILTARSLVLPSFAEGLPVVIMEAMALRRPVLTTYVAGIPELVRHGESGWIFPAGSIDELARAMTECLSTPQQELQTIGEAAYARVIARHSIDVETSKLALLFRTTVSS